MVEALVLFTAVLVVWAILDSIWGKRELRKSEQFQIESMKMAEQVRESTNAELEASRVRAEAYNSRIFRHLDEQNELLRKILAALEKKGNGGDA